MTEQSGWPPLSGQVGPAGQPPDPASMGQQYADPVSNTVAAAQMATGGTSAAASGDAGPNLDQMREQVTREVLLPMEERINAMIDDFKSKDSQRDREIAWLRLQLQATQATVGAPPAIKYATAVSERMQAAAASSALGKDHWAPALALTAQLAADAEGAVKNEDGSVLSKGIADVERWITSTHVRNAGGHVEHFPALLGDLEELALAAEKLGGLAAAAV